MFKRKRLRRQIYLTYVLDKCSLILCIFEFQEYIHRVGRTARGEGGIGHALLCLRPEELGFLRYLKQAKVPLNEFEFSWSKISNIQPQVHVYISLWSDFVEILSHLVRSELVSV